MTVRRPQIRQRLLLGQLDPAQRPLGVRPAVAADRLDRRDQVDGRAGASVHVPHTPRPLTVRSLAFSARCTGSYYDGRAGRRLELPRPRPNLGLGGPMATLYERVMRRCVRSEAGCLEYQGATRRQVD